MSSMYGICRVQKIKSPMVGAMQYHNDREPGVHSNPDIDPIRSGLNHEYIKHGRYQDEIQQRIDEHRVSNRAVRKDAVVMVQGIVTASPEFFATSSKEQAADFFNRAFEFVRSEMGDKNLIHFTVHMDEMTPHAHWGATLITDDGKMGWKNYFDGRDGLSKFQDRFFEQVGEPLGLERGQKDTGRKHLTVREMKAKTEKELFELTQEKEESFVQLQEAAKLTASLSSRSDELSGAIEAKEEKKASLDVELDFAASVLDRKELRLDAVSAELDRAETALERIKKEIVELVGEATAVFGVFASELSLGGVVDALETLVRRGMGLAKTALAAGGDWLSQDDKDRSQAAVRDEIDARAKSIADMGREFEHFNDRFGGGIERDTR